MRSPMLVFWIVLLAVFATAYGAKRWFDDHDATGQSKQPTIKIGQNTLPVGKPLDHFTLTERSGKPLDSKELAGQVWVANFFFANCPGYCMQLNQSVAEIAKEFGPRGVRFTSISVDPANDTPQALASYADRFKANPQQWLFLTGDLPYIERVGRDIFKVSVQKETHYERGIVIDRQGRIRGYFNLLDPRTVGEMKEVLEELLAEPGPPAEPTSPTQAAASSGDSRA